MAEPVIDVRATGVAEQEWESWRRARAPMTLPAWSRLFVMAAHPDDEVLGAGGLIAMARTAGIPVTIVTATDGEGSHPDSLTHGPARLARLRVHEARSAARELKTEDPVRLGFPDGELATHESRLGDRLCALLEEADEARVGCAVIWRHDGHPDHEALGRAGAAACAVTGAELLEYPVWMWQWGDPEHPRLQAEMPVALALSPAAREAKNRALTCFRSQFLPLSDAPADQPIVPAHVLRRFTGPTEIYFR
ncbi:PIG-L deacetylase family protein [Nocardia jejuensis]|uniref:PIG-L deacetylase family protein n=1 Tax=Nocardia jejuensis TaxID=328049 RepID=UPI0008354867|nr:PIG-L family deacetylase [Nocardia jejuensis]